MKATRLNHHRVFLTAVLAGLLALAGCAGNEGFREALEKTDAEDMQQNKRTALAVGQRTFDIPIKILMKACVTAFSNKNLSVTNLDKEMGFIIAEGGNIISPEKEKRIITKRNERLSKEYPFIKWIYIPGNYNLRINMNLFKKSKNRTLAKMSFSSRTKPPPFKKGDSFVGTYEGISKELLPVWYQEMWDEIEKSIFMQRETILEK